MSKRAEEAAMKAYPVSISADSIEENFDWNEEYRGIYTEGYEQAEKDMKEWFIQFVHRHYPLNYIGWIKDFERVWEENNG